MKTDKKIQMNHRIGLTKTVASVAIIATVVFFAIDLSAESQQGLKSLIDSANDEINTNLMKPLPR